jgi:hypothetical protein
VVFGREQVLGADHERGRHADAVKELAELAADVAAAEDDDRFRSLLEFECRVAIEEAGFGQARDDRRRGDAAGRDDEAGRVEHLIAHLQRGRREEARVAHEDRIGVDTGDAVVGPILNQRPLPRRQRRVVEARRAGVKGEFVGGADVVETIGTCQHRLRRHAPAQDAQASQRTAVDKRHVRAEIARGAGCGVTAAACADYNEIETMWYEGAPNERGPSPRTRSARRTVPGRVATGFTGRCRRFMQASGAGDGEPVRP